MFSVNWNWFAQVSMPEWWRKTRMVAFVRLLLSPVAYLHGVFLTFRSRTIYDMEHTGQTMSLEHCLNDRFDPIDRGVWIENLDDLTQTYIYRKVEDRPTPILYRRWDPETSYPVGRRVSWNGIVWSAALANLNEQPGANAHWAYVGKTFRLLRKGETLQPFDFIVWTPILLVFDEAEMRALIDTYRMAGKRYSIQTY